MTVFFSVILVSIMLLISSCAADEPTIPVEAPRANTPAATAVTPVTIEPVATSAPVVPSTLAAPVFIRLADPLDEPEYYCLDVPGAGRGVRLDSPLQAHTCKPVAEAADELFTLNQPSNLQIYMPAYDLCLAASGPAAGAILHLQSCADTPLQRFVFTPDGYLRPEEQDHLCLAIDPGPGIPTGGPSHLRRDLGLEDCQDIEPSLAQWLLDEHDIYE